MPQTANKINLTQAGLDEKLQTMRGCAETLEELKQTLQGRPFGAGGGSQSQGPAASAMASANSQLAITIHCMARVIRAGVAHVEAIREDLLAADAAGGGA